MYMSSGRDSYQTTNFFMANIEICHIVDEFAKPLTVFHCKDLLYEVTKFAVERINLQGEVC